MPDDRDLRFFPTFIETTMGVLLEIIVTLVDEIFVSNLFEDGAFASVNLIEPYIILGCKRLSDKEEYGAQASFPTTCSRRSRTAIHCRSCLSASSLAT